MSIDERDYAGKSDRDLLIEIYVSLQEQCGIMEDHECRIRAIEGGQNKVLAIAAALGVALGALGSQLRALLPF